MWCLLRVAFDFGRRWSPRLWLLKDVSVLDTPGVMSGRRASISVDFAEEDISELEVVGEGRPLLRV